MNRTSPRSSASGARARRDAFGTVPGGGRVDLVTLANAHGMEIRLMSYGGIILSITAPDRDGVFDDIVLGYATLEDYLADSAYMGALIGRYANRIANGRFTLDGVTYTLPRNDGTSHLHGGPHGFHRVCWDVELFEGRDHAGAVLRHTSPNGDSGYPGTLAVQVTYTLSADNALTVDYHATTYRATPLNLTQHSYFNLAGQTGADILAHRLTLRAARFTPVDASLIPLGTIAAVRDTPFDFTSAQAIGARIGAQDEQLRRGRGYDHNFVLDRDEGRTPAPAAELYDPKSGRMLQLYTTEPGIQFYSGNHLGAGRAGKHGRCYAPHSGLALETQHFPDSPNEPGFPSTILRPGAEYHSCSVYRFSYRPAALKRSNSC
ncbi:MAG TPA: aldose epimerase family protein [Gemmatimonadaceae bacterium]|nr:aldose epimerase family protein [Gemmatimonadaceae bacterium]